MFHLAVWHKNPVVGCRKEGFFVAIVTACNIHPSERIFRSNDAQSPENHGTFGDRERTINALGDSAWFARAEALIGRAEPRKADDPMEGSDPMDVLNNLIISRPTHRSLEIFAERFKVGNVNFAK